MTGLDAHDHDPPDPEAFVQPSVRRAVLGSMDKLSNSERKVARALLATYPGAGLTTVADLAEVAGVSPPTVIRFATRLGYSGYPQFQKALVHEVNEGMGSPLAQYGDLRRVSDEDLLPFAARTFQKSLDLSFAELSEWEFQRLVRFVCDESRDIRVIGGRFSRLLADYLTSHLHLLRPRVQLVTGHELQRLATIADTTASTVLVVYDYRRYDEGIWRFAQAMKEHGATLLLLTDNWLSPIAKFADVVLPSRVEAPSPFDSLVPAMAVTEALIAAVTDTLGDRARERLEKFEGFETLPS